MYMVVYRDSKRGGAPKEDARAKSGRVDQQKTKHALSRCLPHAFFNMIFEEGLPEHTASWQVQHVPRSPTPQWVDIDQVYKGTKEPRADLIDILWMDEILHHLRSPGMMIPLYTNKQWFQRGFNVVRNGFRPCTEQVGTCDSFLGFLQTTEIQTPMPNPRP